MFGNNVTVVALTSSGNPWIYLGRLDNSLIDRAEESCSDGYTFYLHPDETILYWLTIDFDLYPMDSVWFTMDAAPDIASFRTMLGDIGFTINAAT